MKKGKLFIFLSSIFVSLAIVGCKPSQKEASLSIATMPSRINFKVGESFATDGLKIINKDTKEEIFDYTTNIQVGYTFQKEDVAEHKEITITKPGYNKTFYNIRVYEIKDMEIESLPTKTSYKVGESFSLNGLKVVDKETRAVLTGYETSTKEGYVFTSTGTVIVNITLKEYNSISFNITVANKAGLKIKQLPDKTTYNVGDRFSNHGLVVSDTDDNIITEYDLSIEPSELLKTAGIINVIVSKENYESTYFPITVIDNGRPRPEGTKKVNVYYVNDVHGSFKRDDDNREAGMAYISSYLKYKKSVENCLILSGGDMFQGGVECNNTKGKIMIDAMNNIGFDAMVLGNHEFDWGEEVIANNSALMDFPLISCNTFYANSDIRPTWITPYTIINKFDLKIGIVGFAKSKLDTSITGSISENFYFPNPIEYVKEYAMELRTSYNCDLILAAGHDGGDESSYNNPYKDWTEKCEKTNLPYVDGIFFAHDHQKKSGFINGTPFVESGCNGQNIAFMDFVLTADTINNNYKVTCDNVGTFNAYINCTTEDTEITALLEKYKDEIGDTTKIICTFSRNYSKEEFAYLACQAMYWYVNNHKDYFNGQQVYMATHNDGGVRAEVKAGAFTYGDFEKCFPFINPLCIQKCTQSQFNYLYQGRAANQAYIETSPVYIGGVTTCVTINYIAEYSTSYQESFVKYESYTSKDAMLEFLTNGLYEN